jgi:hypothetical protein
MNMLEDFTTARLSDFTVETQRGPHQVDGSRYLWMAVSATFETARGLHPVMTVSVPVGINGKTSWSEVESEALEGARAVLNHASLQVALSGSQI